MLCRTLASSHAWNWSASHVTVALAEHLDSCAAAVNEPTPPEPLPVEPNPTPGVSEAVLT